MNPFWENKKLREPIENKWESLCDGCTKSCAHKLEDEDAERFATPASIRNSV